VIGKIQMAWDRPDVRNSFRWRLYGARIANWRAGAIPTVAQRAPSSTRFHPPTPSEPSWSPNSTQPLEEQGR
jgi:hypothetical protein